MITQTEQQKRCNPLYVCKCPLCDINDADDFHHVVPVSLVRKNKNQSIRLCKSCHRLIHKQLTDQQLFTWFGDRTWKIDVNYIISKLKEHISFSAV